MVGAIALGSVTTIGLVIANLPKSAGRFRERSRCPMPSRSGFR